MLHRFHLPEASGDPRYPGPLVFVWDDQAGTVTGPGAATVLALIDDGWVDFGPHPRASWVVGAESLRSFTDMAAIIGHAWCLPRELVDDYPQQPDDTPEQTHTDTDDVTHIGRDLIRY